MVPLGYGRFVRADDIVAVLPIEDGRGRGRRTHVHVAGIAAPIVASRSEGAILADMKAASGSSRRGISSDTGARYAPDSPGPPRLIAEVAWASAHDGTERGSPWVRQAARLAAPCADRGGGNERMTAVEGQPSGRHEILGWPEARR